MYQKYWGLEKRPFINKFDKDLVFFTDSISKTFNMLLFSLIEGKNISVLFGEKGTGKTHLITMLQDELHEEMPFIIINCFEGFDKESFMRELSFKLCENSGERSVSSLEKFFDDLQRNYKIDNSPFVLVIDNAHLVKNNDIFHELETLLFLSEHEIPIKNIILSGRTSLIDKLEKGSKLMSKSNLLFELERFNQVQIKNYITHKLKIAGLKQEVFSAKAVDLISKHSKGSLKNVNLLCRLSMLAASQRSAKSIDDAIVNSTIKECSLAAKRAAHFSKLTAEAKPREVISDLTIAEAEIKEKSTINQSGKESVISEELAESAAFIEREISDKEKQKAKNIYKEIYQYVSEILESFESKDSADLSKVAHYADIIVKNLERNNGLLLEAIKPTGAYDIVRHIVNVAIITVKIGLGMEYKSSDLAKLAQVGLLHDIGMIKIPRSILEKPGRLTSSEFKEIKSHPTYSYQLIKAQGKEYEWIADIVHQEHEQEDGKGYPLGIKSNEIHEFASVIRAADIFEAYGHNRSWRARFIPYRGMQEVIKLKNKSISNRIIKGFVKEFSLFPLNSYVLLNNGEIGIVIKTDRKNLMRPVLRIMFDSKGRQMKKEDKKIILSQTPFLFITKALQEDELPQAM